MATQIIPGVQYSGIWTMQQVNAAIAAGTWPTPTISMYSWGGNSGGQLGTGNTTNYSSPKQVGSGSSWKNIHMSATNTFGIKSDNSLWSWGYNYVGALGNGNETPRSSPVQVGALTNWLRIAGSYSGIIAVKTDGTLWAWGDNSSGQLGLGNTTNYSSPKQVGALTNWSSVAAGGIFSVGTGSSYGLKTDGTLWAWGGNNNGQLGLGNTVSYSSPKQIGALSNWLQIAAGYSSALAVKTDGTLWAWGRNNFGQLGFGNTTNYSSPKQIGALTTWSSVSIYFSSFAIKNNNTLWAWGYNDSGRLGLGNLTNYSSPKQVGLLTNWSKVFTANNGNFTLSIKTDGTLWTWGGNGSGQLGLGNITDYSSPKQVGASSGWSVISAGNSAIALI